MIQRQVLHFPQARQTWLRIAAAAFGVGRSPIAARSRQARPTPTSLHVDGVIDLAMACANRETDKAAGVICESMSGPILGIGAACRKLSQPTQPCGAAIYPSASQVVSRRGYAGGVPTDCLRHDDYRSADFNGPMVSP